ncbi:recombinase family protein [Liquorilactobacillus sucicola]|uniref:recombinase family protein n=1 Tax=Liquorilactobacillus sucicola TaxID=519050 RepID=UPI001269877F
MRKQAASGDFRVSSAPYGYDIQDGNLIVNHAEARIVKSIFQQFLHGTSTNQIAKKLNAQHLPTQRGHHGRAIQ